MLTRGRHADLVIALGARCDDRSSASWMPGYSWNFPAAKLVHVDVDHAELGRNYAPDLGIPADARVFLQQLLAEGRPGASGNRTAWHAEIAACKAEWESYIRHNSERQGSPARPAAWPAAR